MPAAKRVSPPTDGAVALAKKGKEVTVEEVRLLLRRVRSVFTTALREAGFDRDEISKLSAKFRDAGRRSAPWRPTSSLVPGRPQTGADGNRIDRWRLPPDHKFYADEITATLVEIKFFLQALSMDGAPLITDGEFRAVFTPWLLEHEVLPDTYVEPVQLIPVELGEILRDRRRITSGHLVPLDRNGAHVPSNTFLIYGRSNQLQGNMRLDELLTLAAQLVERHKANGSFPLVPQLPPEGIVKGVEAQGDA